MAKSRPKAKSKAKSKSKPKSKPVTVAGLKRAIEGRKANALAGLYADDAVLQDGRERGPYTAETYAVMVEQRHVLVDVPV